MIDIETLGVGAGSVILSYSAVAWDMVTGEELDYITRAISVEESMKLGHAIDGATLKWWMSQPKEVFLHAMRGSDHPHVSLRDLNNFINNHYEYETSVWANSPSFDCNILRAAMDEAGLDPAWKFYDERDVRTVKNLHPAAKLVEFTGAKHNDLDDCRHQIKQVMAVLSQIN